MDTMHVILTTVIGSGAGTAIVSYLFQMRLQRELERHKSLLQRATKLHERRIDVLSFLHGRFRRALITLERISSGSETVSTPGGGRESVADSDLRTTLWSLLKQAYDHFADNELLMPPTLVAQVEKFFAEVNRVQFNFDIAAEFNYPNDDDAKAFWQAASTSVYGDLGYLLRAIEREARTVLQSNL